MSPTLRRLSTAALGSALLAAVLAFPAAAGTPSTLYVDDDGKVGPRGCNGTSIDRGVIQAAIDQAAPGDTVLICPGTYPGSVTVTTPDLTLRAVEPHTAILTRTIATASRSRPSGGEPVPSDALVSIAGADRVTVRGLVLVAPAPALVPAGPGCTIGSMVLASADANGTRVLDNRIRTSGPNTLDGCGYNDGIVFMEGSGGRAVGNVITNFAGTGVLATGEGTRLLSDGNTVRFWHRQEPPTGPVGFGAFSCRYGAGISYSDAAVGSITDNVVEGLDTAGYTTPLICPGIYLQGAGPAIPVRRNRVTNAFDAINTGGAHDWVLTDNRFLKSRNIGLLVLGSRRGLAEDTLVKGTVGIGIKVEDEEVGPPIAAAAYGSRTVAGSFSPRNNTFRDNLSIGNGGRDCLDQTTGSRTKGTANTWTGNRSDGNDRPNGICPPR